MDRRAAIGYLICRGWLSAVPADFRSAMLSAAHLAKLDPGEFVFHAGDPPGGIFGIAEGGIGVYLRGMNDSMRLASVLRPGIWFGQGPLEHGGRRTMSFRATEPSTMLQVSLAALHTIGSHSIPWTRALGTINIQAMSVAERVINDLSIPDSCSRLAATLLRCADLGHDLLAEQSPPYPLRLTQDEISEMANASRQTVSRHLRTFAARGWIRSGYRQILIINPAALTRCATGCD